MTALGQTLARAVKSDLAREVARDVATVLLRTALRRLA